MPEKAWQKIVTQLARTLGFAVYHTHFSKWSEKGYPDLTLVRDRVIFAELKTDTGKVTPEQEAWMGWLKDAGAEVYVWRPRDWDHVRDVLTRRER